MTLNNLSFFLSQIPEPQDPPLENCSSLLGGGAILHQFFPYTSVAYHCGYICLLCCSRHTQTLEYAVTLLWVLTLTAPYSNILSTFTGV